MQKHPTGNRTDGNLRVGFSQQHSVASLTASTALVSVVKSTTIRASRSARSGTITFSKRRDHLAPRPIITLTTDYGTNDHLVGTLKGVILKINPDVTIVDISHDVTPYDLLDGALTIGSSYPYFPPRTIHVVVVDPGVGTERRPLLVSGQNQYFLAPDNGVLSGVFEKEETFLVRHLTAEHYFLHPVSNTFHGRDVFAAVAGWLSKNWQPGSMGEEITDFKRFALPRPKEADGLLKGVVLKVDSFGNLITNFREEDLPAGAIEKGAINLQVGG